jgi:uncharacterized RDD family membrane protein YckC
MDQYHTGWQRFVALLIDSMVLSAMAGTVAWLMALGLGVVANVVFAIVYSITPVAYSVYMHGRFGQTLGKFFLKIRVVSLDGRRISYEQAALRDILPCLLLPVSLWLSLYVAVTGEQPDPTIYQSLEPLALTWVFLEMATMLLNEQRRAVHDFIARTVVVRVS